MTNIWDYTNSKPQIKIEIISKTTLIKTLNIYIQTLNLRETPFEIVYIIMLHKILNQI